MSARCRIELVPLALIVAGLISSPAAAESGDWKAGSASVEITPEQSMWMAGYGGRNRPSEGKLTDLWAKALILQDASGDRAVLVTMDLIGIDRTLAKTICDQLAARFQLQRRQIALCTSHTHTGPALSGNLSPLHFLVVDQEQQRRIAEYSDNLQERVMEVVDRAMTELVPVDLSWGSGTAGFAVNRRNNRPESVVPQLRAQGELKGPVDHDVPVLCVRAKNGDLQAVVFGYACHATVLSFYQWSGDYPGFAQAKLEADYPGCQAMFWAGCGGDQNPLPRRSVSLAEDYGRQLAEAVNDVLEGEMQPLSPQLRATYQEIALPFAALPTREQIAADMGSENRFVAARGKLLDQQIQEAGELKATYPYPIQTWQLGDEIQFIILGGEVVVDFSIRLKSELRGQKTWVAAYANDVMAYIASRRILLEGGYEGASAMVYYGLPSSWALDSERLIIDQVHQQLK
jgi:hypothetical protein